MNVINPLATHRSRSTRQLSTLAPYCTSGYVREICHGLTTSTLHLLASAEDLKGPTTNTTPSVLTAPTKANGMRLSENNHTRYSVQSLERPIGPSKESPVSGIMCMWGIN